MPANVPKGNVSVCAFQAHAKLKKKGKKKKKKMKHET